MGEGTTTPDSNPTGSVLSIDITGGAFVTSLKRNNKQIRDDRATSISEDAALMYKREIEDIEMKIKRVDREREAMLDMSPTDKTSLIVAGDFDAKLFVEKDIQLGIDRRNLEIKREIALNRYNALFVNQDK